MGRYADHFDAAVKDQCIITGTLPGYHEFAGELFSGRIRQFRDAGKAAATEILGRGLHSPCLLGSEEPERARQLHTPASPAILDGDIHVGNLKSVAVAELLSA